ncbi:protein LURP-one-related 8-like [Phalaenopsis equestris]|uniref:protein LURP-one-related 8-like n=1 Tax=Phalaenopsis equestris TaxID=78828 RepID=UPI0009E4221F|nr:protein LURP-one-related 8-like [Phalaenopsis equestris]
MYIASFLSEQDPKSIDISQQAHRRPLSPATDCSPLVEYDEKSTPQRFIRSGIPRTNAVDRQRSRLFSPPVPPPSPAEAAPAALTVWLKSLLFNCNGFTVFDSKGNLVFRVDEYARSGNKGEIVLMDAAGNSRLTIRRKKLSLGEHWQIYDGEEAANPLFSVRKYVKFIQSNSKSLAHVSPCVSPPGTASGSDGGEGFEVEGFYAQRCCQVYDGRRRVVAEIRRKEDVGGAAFGLDVFRLVVQPGFDVAVAMAIVIVLEEMFGSRRSEFRV